uniref:Anaphase-promoting complex subunit 4 WD40 domain-containing protein n=1 Tax=Biomphalaria glabrata TaxID=6526 RepID=A0A2C9JMH7_BIOGL
MDVTHSFALPLHINPQRLDPCISRQWIALPLSKSTMGLWKTDVSYREKSYVIECRGHVQEICAFTFSNRFPVRYLASVCMEKIMLWDLNAGSNETNDITSKQFYHNVSEISAICFNNLDDIIAMAADNKIVILKFKFKEPMSSFDGHRAMITKLKFCPHYSATLVSISDDRTFCVWNIFEKQLLYQSTMISSSPLISITMNLVHPQVVIGTADGCLKVFDLTDGNNFRPLTSLDLSLHLKKRFEPDTFTTCLQGNSINRNVNKNMKQEFSDNDTPTVIQSSESVLSVEFIYLPQSSYLEDSEGECIPIIGYSSIQNILEQQPPLLCAITTNAMVLIHSKTFEVTDAINFQSPLKSCSFSSLTNVGTVAYAGISQTDTYNVVAVVGGMMCNKMDVLNCVLFKQTNQHSSEKSDGDLFSNQSLSIVPVISLLPTSPLNCIFLPPVAISMTRGDVASGKKNSSNPLNQPLTFKSQIKSSGYLQPARTTMFKPSTDKYSLLNMKKSDNTSKSNKKMLNKSLKSEYDTSKGPPTEYHGTYQIDTQTTAVLSMRFSDDGERLGCALTNKFGLLIKSPFKEDQSIPLIGHNSTVNSVYFSNCSSYVLTASNDKSVCLWGKAGGDPVMKLTHQRSSVKESMQDRSSVTKPSASLKRNPLTTASASSSLSQLSLNDNAPYSKELKNAQFFYVDKFILLTHGPDLYLYKYYITDEKDDIKRYQLRNRYKIVSSWQTSSSAFTSMAAVNNFHSYLVISATSGRTIEIYDLNKSLLAHVFSDCHSRSVHSITINESSCFSSQPQQALNVFATIAPTDPIKLWDIRTKSNIQSMQGHSIKAHSCQITFSPCGNFIAAGSEDRMVYLYDIRMGTYCDRLKGHNEVVTSVAFHPAKPFLATGSLNSKILFFKTKS